MEDEVSYNIRPMTLDDIDLVVAGETKAFGKSLGRDLITFDLKSNPYAYYFVLEVNDQISGYISSWIYDDGNAQILNVYVDDKYRGYGFGRDLVSFICELCDESGVDSLTLEVRPSNEVALNLYSSFGFNKISVRKRYYDNSEDAWCLQRKKGGAQ